MTLLPIVERELRVKSRRAWTYWGRTLAASLGFLTFLALVSQNWGLSSNALARGLFVTLSGAAYGFALLAGTLFSAHSLAREHHEGTLGLLFLTDLRSLDITLGKLVGTGVGSVYCLGAAMPVLAIPLLMGGVAGEDYLRMVGALLATLWLSLTIGLLASTLAGGVRTATAWSAALMFLACEGSWLGSIAWELGPASTWAPVPPWMGGCAPHGAFLQAIATPGQGVPTIYGVSLAFTWVLGGLALGGATLRLPHLWQDKAAAPKPSRARTSGAPAARTPGGRDAKDHPIAWLSNRSARVRWSPWLVLTAVGLCWFLTFVVLDAGDSFWIEAGWILISLTLHAAFKCWLAVEAPRVFHDARHNGGVELLITTGLTDADLLHGRLRALRRLCLGPLVAITAMDVGLGSLFLANFPDFRSDALEIRTLVWVGGVGHLALLWVDALAIAVTGTWIGARTRGQRAAGATWLCVLFLPYLLWISGAVLEFGNQIRGGLGLLLAWLLLNLAVSGVNAAWSHARLTEALRASLGQPLGRPPRRADPI